MPLRPGLIWRYVFREVRGPIFLGLMVYVLVFLMNALFELAALAIKKDMRAGVVLRLLVYLLPRVLEMTLPMAVLLGTLVGIGRLSADSEVVALRASGVSYKRLLLPVLTLACLCWGASSLLMLKVEPKAHLKQRRLLNEQLYSADLRREIKPRVFFEEVPGLLLYANQVFQGGTFLEGVFLHQTDPEGREQVTLARRGQIDYDRHTGVANFILEGGANHTITPGEPESYQISRFDRQRFVREPDDSFKMKMSLLSRPSQKNYMEQSLTELQVTAQNALSITDLSIRRRVLGAVSIYQHERFALPFACIAFALIGLPLGIANRRGGKASGFTLSIAIAIGYWLLYSFGQNLVREGRLSPFIGMWLANGLLSGLGISLLALREQSESLEIRSLSAVKLRAVSFLARIPVPGRTWLQRKGDRDDATRPSGSSEVRSRPNRLRSPHLLAILLATLIAVLLSIFVTPFALVAFVILATIMIFSSTLDHHVLNRFMAILGGCLLSFFTLFAVYEFVGLLDDMVQRNQPTSLAVRYLAFRSPWILAQILPMSCLVACLLTFGIMSRFNEVTAVKASGTSIYRLAGPVLFATIAISIMSYVNSDYIVPYSYQRATQIKDVIHGRSPRSYQAGDERWVFGAGGRLYNFSNYVAPPIPVLPSAGIGTFEGFSVYFLNPHSSEMTARLYARQASYKSGSWILKDGWSREFKNEGEVFERFAEKSFDFPEGPAFFIREWKTPEQMTFTELRRFVADLQRRGYDAQELLVDLYGKSSMPLVPLTLVILGLPFCFRIGRRGSLYGVGVSIVLAALYFLTFSATSALGSTGLMPAFLAAWAPNILFAGVGAYMLLHTPT